MRLIICRHSIRECTTESDCSISVEGVELINNRMNEIRQHIMGNCVSIFTSPYRRAIETSYCISNNLSCNTVISMNIELRETVFNNNQINKLPLSLFELIKKNSINNDTLDTWNDIFERAKNFLKYAEIFAESFNNDTIIAVSHGAPINAIIKTVDPTHVFDDANANPTTYIPKYFDYAVLNFDTRNKKWEIIYKNF